MKSADDFAGSGIAVLQIEVYIVYMCKDAWYFVEMSFELWTTNLVISVHIIFYVTGLG